MLTFEGAHVGASAQLLRADIVCLHWELKVPLPLKKQARYLPLMEETTTNPFQPTPDIIKYISAFQMKTLSGDYLFISF